MKKILLILNESHIPQRAIKTAIQIANKSNSIIEAIFINDISRWDIGYPFPNDLFLAGTDLSPETRTEENIKALESIAAVFKDECTSSKVSCKIEIDKSVSVKHLLKLSCFADLIIADANSDSGEYSFKDILADAHCPLLLVSKNANPVEKIYVAYDGSPSSMYAVKMFSYIFPEYKDRPIHFFHIASEKTDVIPHLDEITSWAAKHFPTIKYELITGTTKSDLVEHVRENSEKTIIVMGAYSGSSIARLLFKSTAELVINETNASLFITHQ